MKLGRKQRVEVNLLELRPRPKVAAETTEDGLLVLLVPKFRWGPLAGWLMAHLAKPYVRVKLDRFGSFFFRQLDGATPVGIIVERMRREFGEDAEPAEARVGRFLKQLERGELVDSGLPAKGAGR